MSALKPENEKIIKELFRRINYMGNEDTLAMQISVHLKREHRTLVQSFFRMVKQVIEEYAGWDDSQTDQRNLASINWAKDVAKIKKYLPTI